MPALSSQLLSSDDGGVGAQRHAKLPILPAAAHSQPDQADVAFLGLASKCTWKRSPLLRHLLPTPNCNRPSPFTAFSPFSVSHSVCLSVYGFNIVAFTVSFGFKLEGVFFQKKVSF